MIDLYEGVLGEFAEAQSLGARHKSELNDVGVYLSRIHARAPRKPWSPNVQRGILLDLISEGE